MKMKVLSSLIGFCTNWKSKIATIISHRLNRNLEKSYLKKIKGVKMYMNDHYTLILTKSFFPVSL